VDGKEETIVSNLNAQKDPYKDFDLKLTFDYKDGKHKYIGDNKISKSLDPFNVHSLITPKLKSKKYVQGDEYKSVKFTFDLEPGKPSGKEQIEAKIDKLSIVKDGIPLENVKFTNDPQFGENYAEITNMNFDAYEGYKLKVDYSNKNSTDSVKLSESYLYDIPTFKAHD